VVNSSISSGRARVAIVTAADTAVGRHIATILMRNGVAVVANYAVNMRATQDVVLDIQRRGGQAVAGQGAATDQIAIAELFYTATTRFGRLDFIFHTVGATVSACEVVQVTALRCSGRCGGIVIVHVGCAARRSAPSSATPAHLRTPGAQQL
jgi:NAD(P)-dependent dehydrogenase (short-subunit alcohol dehydrogenase family)